MSLIEAGDDAAVHKVLDNLIADFSDEPDLPAAIFRVGDVYYNKGFEFENRGLNEKAEDCFRKTIAVWERITKELPKSPTAAQAYYLAGRCYERLGEYENAIEHYQVVLDYWPAYERAWSAQFLAPLCFDELEKAGVIARVDAALEIIKSCEDLLASYPDCKAVAAARDLLERWSSVRYVLGEGEEK